MQRVDKTLQDRNGNVVGAAVLTITDYPSGTTSTAYATDAVGANVNPITLDSNGQCTFYIVPGAYTYTFVKSGITTKVETNVIEGSASQSFLQSGTGAVSRTVQSKLQDVASVKDYGATGDGSADDTAEINLGIAAINAGEIKGLFFPAGRYLVSSALTTITANGAFLYGEAGSGITSAIIQSSTTANTLTFSNATPASNRIADIAIHDLAIWGPSNPTAGRGLTLVRPGRAKFSNLDIRNMFQGFNIQGGADCMFSNIAIGGPATWSSLASGSYCAQIEMETNSSEVPGEMFFTNCNWKGSAVGGANYLDNATVIKACDGLWFTNFHTGFAKTNSIQIAVQASANVEALFFNGGYADGGLTSYGTGSGVVISGSQAITNIGFSNFVVKNHALYGVHMSATNASRIRFNGGEISTNLSYGMVIGAQIDVSVIGVDLFNNNAGNLGVYAIIVNGVVTGLKIRDCNIRASSYAHVIGISILASSTGVSIEGCTFDSCTTPMALNGTACMTKGNQLVTGVPTVVAAAALPATYLGFDRVEVTGNTNITSIAGNNNAQQVMILSFTGTPTLTNGNNILLAGSANVVCTAGTQVMLCNDGTAWSEVSRAIR